MMLHDKQKPYYCMEHHYVNAEATSIESGLSYSGRSACNPSEVRESAKEETAFKAGKAMNVWCRQKSAEVVVGQDTSCQPEERSMAKVSQTNRRTEC